VRYIPPTTDHRLAFDGPDEDDPLAQRLERVAVQLSETPISVFSTLSGPNVSGVTAPRKGQLGVEIGSGLTPLWVSTSDGTNNWSALSFT